MTLIDEKYYMRAAWIWVLGCAVLRFIYSGLFPLVADETNYWQWSRYLAPGYYDQAPMIAWAIKVSTAILGQTEIGVRFPSVMAMTIASVYLIVMANRWVGPFAAFNTAILSQAILEFNVGGILATPDGLQAAAWAGACYHIARAYENNSWSQWLLGGLWFGFGMLSKYTMVIFLPCAYLYGLTSSTHRIRLAGIRPYAGVLLGLLMFCPVILWNAQNNWSSVRHVAYIGGANKQFSIHLKYFGDYLAAQAALLSPLVFILGLWAWARVLLKKYQTRNWIYPYLFFTSFPMFAGFTLLSFHTRVNGNWPGAGYLMVSILVVAFLNTNPERRSKTARPNRGQKLFPWAIGTAYFFTAVVFLEMIWPVLPLSIKLDRVTREVAGWRELGQVAGKTLARMPDPQNTFLFGLRYQTASELAFYTPGQPRTVSINRWNRPNVYDFWWKDADLIGKDALGVTYNPNSHETLLKQVFERVDPPQKIIIYKKNGFMRRRPTQEIVTVFYLYHAYGFKGGLRWKPLNKSDVRAGSYPP